MLLNVVLYTLEFLQPESCLLVTLCLHRVSSVKPCLLISVKSLLLSLGIVNIILSSLLVKLVDLLHMVKMSFESFIVKCLVELLASFVVTIPKPINFCNSVSPFPTFFFLTPAPGFISFFLLALFDYLSYTIFLFQLKLFVSRSFMIVHPFRFPLCYLSAELSFVICFS